MSGDARTVAWMGAWNRITEATDYRRAADAADKVDQEEVRRTYDRLIVEADLFAKLAAVDYTVGVVAYDNLERLEAQQERERRANESNLERMMREERDRRSQAETVPQDAAPDSGVDP